ncbi:FAD-binding protein [Leptospira noumeaensis]|uniref:FAD-binding protein n=1 Tax=Leptospira noumeaensis TaxID=2484964 RepID=A0A4R9ID73_9LEPT|nr:NAD(P)/FAD-dependent oxidoreductase [Leptospira noumeaensis]TGK84609.1 FAD-binding protein [Leptospira noumeaensis]
MEDHYWDVVVIGSGLGALSAALSFSEKGKKVLILEKGISPGGCASSFQKKGFVFESGATTLVGFEPGLPLDQLTKKFQIQFPVIPLDRSMVVHMKTKTIERYKSRSKWKNESKRVFGGGWRMDLFWDLCFLTSDFLWSLSSRYKNFPFRNLTDIVKTIFHFRVSDLVPLVFSFVSLKRVLQGFGLYKNSEWIQFLDEQLLITNQSVVKDVPFVMAAAGLTYPQLQNYVVEGGMVTLAETILNQIHKNGGKILYKQEVRSLKKCIGVEKERKWNWEIKTNHRENSNFYADLVISNIPIWNLCEITNDLPKLKTQTSKFETGIWGAFTMGIAIQTGPSDTSLTSECLHHQIHLEKNLPYGGGKSVFLSLSHSEDPIRSQNGVRILSLSTHIENPELWIRDEFYKNKKKEIESILIDTLKNQFSWFKNGKVLFLHSATPVTWKTWTGRKFGRVGGIPSSYFLNPFRMIANQSEDPNLLLTGDTVYPGQGIPAVILGGLNVAEQFLARKRG